MSRFHEVKTRKVFGRLFLDITLGEHGKWQETFTVFRSDRKWQRNIAHEEPVVAKSTTKGVNRFANHDSAKHERRVNCRVQHEQPLYRQTQLVEYRFTYTDDELTKLVESYS
jgi:hypothetical protein